MSFMRNELGSVPSYAIVVSLVVLGGTASFSGLGGSFENSIVGATTSEDWDKLTGPNFEHITVPVMQGVAQAGGFSQVVGRARQAMRTAKVAEDQINSAFKVAEDVLARQRTHITAEAGVVKSGDTLFVPVSSRGLFKPGDILDVGDDVHRRIAETVRREGYKREAGTHLEIDGEGTGFRKVVLVGLGDSQASADLRDVGHQIGTLARARDSKGTTSQILLRSDYSADYKGLTEGLLLSDYDFDMFKSTRQPRTLLRVNIGTTDDYFQGRTQMGIADGNAYAESTALARDMTALPPNIFNTNEMVALAALIAERRGLEFEVFSKPDLIKEKMMHIHGVGMASDSPPYLVRLRNQGTGSTPIAAVGKSIMYDSGGLSIKGNPAGMKGDMGGGAALLAAIDGAASRSLDTTVDAYLPIAENAISANAQRVDDVVTGRSGLSVEIGNTDAEGRLVMADALAYATEDGPRKPSSIITVSTLTGANASTFGGEYVGLFTRYDALRDRLMRAAKTAGENFWPMPMDTFYDGRLGSDIADLGNIGAGGAGAITAAIFLSKHVGGNVPFAQLDIAGTAMRSSARGRLPRGPSGSATASLMDWFTNP